MIIKRVFLTLMMSFAMLSINSYAAPLVIVKPEIQKIVSYGGKWHIVYNEVQNGTNLTTEEVFVDGNSDRVVNVGTATRRGFPLVGTYTDTECHKAYITVYDNTRSIVVTSDTFNFGDTTNCSTVIVNDTISPVITLNGTNPQVLSVGEAYTELGALANDNRDGDITNNITIDASAVNVNVAGDYNVVYSVLDAAGNDTTVTRVVKVVALGAAQKPEIHRVVYYGGKWTIVYKDVKISSAYTTEGVFVDNVLDREVNAGSSSTSYDRGFSLSNTTYDQTTCHEAYIVVYDSAKVEVTRSDVFNFGDLTKCGDMVKPEITLTGLNPQVLTVGDTYAELGATALDNVDGDITGNIVIDATAVDTTTVGTYSVTYDVSDAAGNAATTLTRTVNVEAAPVSTADIISVTFYSGNWNIAYVDVPVSPNLGKEKVFVDGVLDREVNAGTTSASLRRGFRLLGSYAATTCHEVYVAVYSNANVELSRTSTFNFGDTTKCGADTEKPVIALTGVNPQQLTVGDTYSELGATASDDRDGDISGNIVINASAVNTAVADSYVVTYNVSDAAGNTAVTLSRTVNVSPADVTKPVLTLVGANVQLIALDQAYIELGATASDDRDGDITANIVIDASAVNTAAVGSYVVSYNVSDAAGNNAVTLTRTVTVQVAADTIKPVITLIGANPQTLIFGQAYTELGATASDNVDGDISANILIDASAVNTSLAGQYIVKYISTDVAGNTATVSRIVNVSSAPTTTGNYYISLTGSDNNDGRTLGTAFKTIAHALDVVVGGDTILIKGGTYRQGEIRYRKENNTGQYITLQNYNNENVVIKGSVAVNGWENYQGNIWKLSATDTSGLNKNVHYQQVFYGDGQRLQKIGYPNYDTVGGTTIWRAYFPRYKAIKTNAANPFGMSEGTFYVKALANGQYDLYVWLPNGKTPNDADVTMEVSDKKYLIDAFNVKNFKLKGLKFMHTASAGYGNNGNGFQGGSGLTLGANAVVEDSEIAYMDFAGINLSVGASPLATDMNQIIRRNKIHHNGSVGISAIAGGYLVDGNEFYENSDRPFLQYWHSGAIKTSANGWGEIKDNYIHDERGQGIWFDNCHSNNPILVHHNYIDGVGNKKANDTLRTMYARGHGLFFEESTNVKAYNNIINMTIQRGIYASLSKNVVISNNLIRKSALEHVAVRYRANYGVIKLDNVKIVNNILMDKRYAGNRPFDVKAFDENSGAVFNPNNIFSGNIVYNTDGTIPKIQAGGSHWTFADNILANPLLITNGSTLLNTWTLDGLSPAVDAGTNYSFITDDNRHNPRNDGTSDIGAFEK